MKIIKNHYNQNIVIKESHMIIKKIDKLILRFDFIAKENFKEIKQIK